MVTRTAFIAIIAVGATFVIAGGGLDLSVGSMAALVAGVMILILNKLGARGHRRRSRSACIAAIGAWRGLRPCQRPDRHASGASSPSSSRSARMGIFRALVDLARGGRHHHDAQSRSCASSTARSISATSSAFRFPIIVFLVVAAIGALILYRTAFGRHVVALGSNEDVARYSGVPIWRVRTLTYVIQGICVGIAVLVYVPRLGSATPTTGLLWELQAITAVVVGGTALQGGIGRIWGTVVGAVILELVANIMVLSNFVSEFLVGAVQGAIIIVAMLVQRSLHRGR